MYSRLDRVHRAVPVILGVFTLLAIGVLFTWDALPGYFPAKSHDLLAAFPLAMIAIAYLVYQTAHRPPFRELLKAIMLASRRVCVLGSQSTLAGPTAGGPL